METTYIQFETAKLAKEKCFVNGSMKYYGGLGWSEGDPIRDSLLICENGTKGYFEDVCEAPKQDLLQKWLRENHYIFIMVNMESLGSDEWGWSYEIKYLPKEFQNAKRRVPNFISIESFIEGGASYSGAWDKYEDALENALQTALNLL